MKYFSQFISEAEASALESANQKNSAFGDAYETATVIHLHNHTAAETNTTTDGYQAKIKLVRQKHKAAMAKLPPNKQEQAVHLANDYVTPYNAYVNVDEGEEFDMEVEPWNDDDE